MEDVISIAFTALAWIAIGTIILLALKGTFFTTEQQTVKVVQRFGKFSRMALSGLNIKIPLIEQVAGALSLRVVQTKVEVETKTSDNVFVRLIISVQHKVMDGKYHEAFYKLTDSEQQIKSFVFDAVRAKVPKMTLDDVFEKKDDIADAVKEHVGQVMLQYGREICAAPVTDIEPDGKVKESMNEINAAQRLRTANEQKGEAEKILVIKAAEADAESKKLAGTGVANQRKEIVKGLEESVQAFQAATNIDAKEVLSLVLLTQYFDTIKEIGARGNSNTIFLSHSPGGLGDIAQQLQSSIVAGDKASASLKSVGNK